MRPVRHSAPSLPEVVDTAGPIAACDPAWFGAAIPICGLAGDQQAATIGQACLAPGATKATFGSGAFILTSTGDVAPRSSHRLLTTVLSQIEGKRLFALEGSIFVAGSMIDWLRDGLGWIGDAAETEALARDHDNGGVTVVPALAGLGAPHWRPDAKAAILGLTLGTRREQIVRAALELIAHQCSDLQTAFAADGAAWRSLRIDGGMAANGWLAQDLCDMLDDPGRAPGGRRKHGARRGDARRGRRGPLRVARSRAGDAAAAGALRTGHGSGRPAGTARRLAQGARHHSLNRPPFHCPEMRLASRS